MSLRAAKMQDEVNGIDLSSLHQDLLTIVPSQILNSSRKSSMHQEWRSGRFGRKFLSGCEICIISVRLRLVTIKAVTPYIVFQYN